MSPAEVIAAVAAELRKYGNDSASHYLAEALAEGLVGTPAGLRAIAIRNQRIAARDAATAALKLAEVQLHTARVQRQAAKLEARARGINAEEIGRMLGD